MDEMFTAVRGKGAFLNGSPIHASSCSSLGSALAISEIGVTRDDETLDALFGRISALTKEVRRFRNHGNVHRPLQYLGIVFPSIVFHQGPSAKILGSWHFSCTPTRKGLMFR